MVETYRRKNRQAAYQNYAKVVSHVNVLRNATKILRNATKILRNATKVLRNAISFERKTKTSIILYRKVTKFSRISFFIRQI